MRCLLLMFLLACGEKPAPTPAPAPAAPPPVAAAPTVGPDGPASITVPALTAISTDPADVSAGEAVWAARGCGGCHAFGSKLVGPDLTGITGRRELPWILKQIAEPEKMTREDPQSKKLLGEFMVQMPKQGVTAEELPKLMAYIKSKGG